MYNIVTYWNIAIVSCKFLLLMICMRHVFGTDIRSVSLDSDVSKTILTSGTLQLNYLGQPTHICHYGDQKNWGKREGDTACKQLGFEGGWPYDVGREEYDSNTQKLNNFDCDETDTDLNSCEYDITDECKNAKLAGAQCYNHFKVQLVGGISSNIGRVEVMYNNEWSSVCYESADGSSNDWSFANAQVVCRELGFPGTMFARQGGQGQGTQRYTVNGYQCREDLRETSLQNCYPDSPNSVKNKTNPSCHFETTDESNEAVVICAVPGYLGCHSNADINSMGAENITSQSLTINVCRRHCRKLIYRYAILRNGDTCFCTSLILTNQLGDTHCRTVCSGNENEVCGDTTSVSVYDVTIGVCSHPLNKTDVYYFGEIFSAFECDNGMEPVNAKTIKCSMATSTNEFIWNDTSIPQCPEETDDCGKIGVPNLLWLILLFPVGIIIGFILHSRKKKLLKLLRRCNGYGDIDNPNEQHSDAFEPCQFPTRNLDTGGCEMTKEIITKPEDDSNLQESQREQNDEDTNSNSSEDKMQGQNCTENLNVTDVWEIPQAADSHSDLSIEETNGNDELSDENKEQEQTTSDDKTLELSKGENTEPADDTAAHTRTCKPGEAMANTLSWLESESGERQFNKSNINK